MLLKPASYPADSLHQHKIDLIIVAMVCYCVNTFSAEEIIFKTIGDMNYVLISSQSVMLHLLIIAHLKKCLLCRVLHLCHQRLLWRKGLGSLF